MLLLLSTIMERSKFSAALVVVFVSSHRFHSYQEGRKTSIHSVIQVMAGVIWP